MGFTIEETVDIGAPIAAVWRFILDPQRIVVCLPGAKLAEVIDERNYKGDVKMKVGPMTVRYSGLITFAEVDEQAHKLVLVGKAKEKGGAGSAKMSMTIALSERDGGTHIAVLADVDVAGKLVSFGRGMIEQISKQLFGQFAERLRSELQSERHAEAETTSEQADAEVAEAASGHDHREPGAAAPPPPPPPPPPHGADDDNAVAALPLMLKALWAWLRELLAKLVAAIGQLAGGLP